MTAWVTLAFNDEGNVEWVIGLFDNEDLAHAAGHRENAHFCVEEVEVES